jgi:hypothetical protein
MRQRCIPISARLFVNRARCFSSEMLNMARSVSDDFNSSDDRTIPLGSIKMPSARAMSHYDGDTSIMFILPFVEMFSKWNEN